MRHNQTQNTLETKNGKNKLMELQIFNIQIMNKIKICTITIQWAMLSMTLFLKIIQE